METNSRLAHFLLVLPIAIAASIIFEFCAWSIMGDYMSHAFTSNLLIWTSKHILIGLALSSAITFFSGEKKRVLKFLGLALIFELLAHVGFMGKWFCGPRSFCSGEGTLIIPFIFGGLTILSIVTLFVLFILVRKFPKWILIVITIASIIFLGFSINRIYRQNVIASEYPFVTDSIDETLRGMAKGEFLQRGKIDRAVKPETVESYISAHMKDIAGKTSDQWQAACSQYNSLSYSSVAYGNTAAMNCFVKGAVLFRDTAICQNVSTDGSASRLNRSECLLVSSPVARPETLLKNDVSGGSYTFSSSSPFPPENYVLINNASTEQEVKQAEQFFIRQKYPTAIILGIFRTPISSANKEWMIDNVNIQIPETGERIKVDFDVTQNVSKG